MENLSDLCIGHLNNSYPRDNTNTYQDMELVVVFNQLVLGHYLIALLAVHIQTTTSVLVHHEHRARYGLLASDGERR